MSPVQTEEVRHRGCGPCVVHESITNKCPCDDGDHPTRDLRTTRLPPNSLITTDPADGVVLGSPSPSRPKGGPSPGPTSSPGFPEKETDTTHRVTTVNEGTR